ncbi:bile acid:sodium symporter [Actinophytocola xinjiangensis]|uniref:Bile acid:sodium symporter n=1 Tax=Actinophytocola xinjiangensis TaxID=485602 RepID=A0A7Z1B032_9PSEU|nr:bile acid:sodium symporter family protein [Actinophytocola xinjiangensis]OLF11459.1 bile acid:sodium symporter [Actinophytocola xinjiangensis]
MNSSTATTVFLPIALGVVMLGLGLSLTTADFRRVVRYPRAAAVALGCQILILPGLCLGLVLLFDLAPALAVGMMLLAASPGGTTANLFSHLAGGDVALNITLTAINSVLAVVTLPIVANLALDGFMSGDAAIGLQPDKLVQVFAIVLVPVAIGMVVRARAPRATARLQRPVKIASVLVLVSVIGAAVYQERDNVLDYMQAVGLVALLLCVVSLTVGYLVPRAFRVPRGQAVASSFEIGVHNSTLAITIALSPALLDNPEMAVPPAVYGILSFLPAGVLAYAMNRRARERVLTGQGD